jgi:uncharacterized repeat protein (TIGR04138 family)
MSLFSELSRSLEPIRRIVRADDRYREEIYLFVQDAFAHALARLGQHRGLTGRELLEGFRRLALERYGPTARLVFEHWGVRTTEDIGRVVMNMVAAGLMRKSAGDTIEDFQDVFDFKEEFEEKFSYRVDRDTLSELV